MSPMRFALLGICASLGTLGCTVASADIEPARWLTVARDANYDVAIDPSRIRAGFEWSGRRYRVYEVWYRTDHRMPREHKGKTFDREVVQSIVQCDSLWFKVISVDMWRGDEKLIARQRTERGELGAEPWRRVVRGTTEEIAAQAACHYGRKRPVTSR